VTAAARRPALRWVAALLLSVAGSGCGASGAVSPSGTAVGVVCIPVGCLSGAVYDGSLTVGNSDPQSLTITACRNGACPYTTLRFDPTQSRFVGRILGPLTVDISLDTSPVPARLFVHIAGRPELLIDGDLYELKVQNAAGASLLALSAAVTYRRTRHSDPSCTADCISAILSAQ
jgi:hypothetical protein